MPGKPRHRIAIGGIAFEGNSLSQLRCERATFEQKYLKAGADLVAALADTTTEHAGALSVLGLRDADIVPLLATHGGAGGHVSRACWEDLSGELLARLEAAMPVDGVYLALHGAMLCEGLDDPEGNLLQRVRAIVGERPIAVSYDLHAHFTRKMLHAADISLAYQLYPHDDCFQTGQRAMGLLLRTLDGEIRPVTSMCKIPMIVQSQRQRTDADTPMTELYRLARGYEAGHGALAVSYFAVQPWLNVPELGFTGVAVTDGDSDLADAIAAAVARKGWALRHDFEVEIVASPEAVRRGLAVAGGPIILADAADCVGGGASGDGVEALKNVLALAPHASVTALIVDAETVHQAVEAGVGARIAVTLGNKQDPAYGPPLQGLATVERIADGRFRYSGGIFGKTEAHMGPTVLLRMGEAHLVVASFPSYEYADEQFTALGVDARKMKFVIVKNPINYQKAFADAAAFFVLDTPGPTTPFLRGIEIPRAGRPFFPFDDIVSPAFVAETSSRARCD